MTHLGYIGGFKEEDFRHVAVPVRICLGSEDRLVTPEESVAASEQIPQGTFSLLEGVPHPLEKVDVELLSKEIKAFLI